MIDRITILRDLKLLLIEKFGNNIKDVILFGSQTKEGAATDSDYDILIILMVKPDWKYEREISKVCYSIDLKYNVITDIHLLAESELDTLRGKQPIFVNAINKGIYA